MDLKKLQDITGINLKFRKIVGHIGAFMYNVAKFISGILRYLNVRLIMPLVNPKITRKISSIPAMQNNEHGVSHNLFLEMFRLNRP